MTGIHTHVKLGQWGQQNLNKTQSAFVYFLCIRTREGGRGEEREREGGRERERERLKH